MIVDNEKVSSTNPNQREFELLDVRSVLTWTRIRQYLDGYYIFNEPEFDMEEKLAESDNSEITEPFVMIELKNESSLRYLTTWLSNPKGTETSEFEEDLLHNEIFSSGSAISERLPQLIISHSYINAGFLQFAKALISECGKTHIFEYAEAGSFTVFLEAFKFYLEKGKLALGIYRNPDHFSCDCWSSSSSSLPHMLSGPSGSTKLCPKDRILLLLPVPDPHKSP